MSKYKTFFNPLWLEDPEFKAWVEKDESNLTQARCKVCHTAFQLSNMAVKALRNHAKGRKHVERLKSQERLKSTPTLSILWGARTASNTSPVPSSSNSDNVPSGHSMKSSVDTNSPAASSTSSAGSPNMEIPPPPAVDTSQSKSNDTVKLSHFMSSDAVLSAEIHWAIKCVTSHYSCNSSANTDVLFRKMFPDSEIARTFQCGATKCMYLICHGLAPYFRGKLVDQLQPGVPYVISFDESLNRMVQEEQMDLMVRFFDEERQVVVTRYLDSQFMGHTKSEDLLTHFLEGLSSLSLKDLLQISMDGPRANWKFFDQLVTCRKSQQLPSLLNLGSCSLHAVHGGFKFGAQKTGWKLDCLLRSMWYCFADSPARREDYRLITKSDTYPLQFCATRWIEDLPVAERALQLLPKVFKYVNETLKTKSKSQLPTASSFKNLQEFRLDKLLEAKLHFFIYVARLVLPFLKIYQSDQPLLPFMAAELETLLRSLMGKFIKADTLANANTAVKLVALDVKKAEHVLPYKKVEIGFAAKLALTNIKGISDLQIMQFRNECILFLQSITSKLQERSPLQYPVVRNMVCLDPSYMISRTEKSAEKFQRVLTYLLDGDWYTAEQCDVLLLEYKELLATLAKYHGDECRQYTVSKIRLDTFFSNIMAADAKLQHIWSLIKRLLILSHGQASIERGFSLNKETLATNMGKKTLIAYRIVQDAIKDSGQKDVIVTKDMITSCRHARTRYQHQLDAEKKKKETSASSLKRKQDEEKLQSSRKKKKVLEKTYDGLISEADQLALDAEKQLLAQKSTQLIVKSNSLRKTARQMKEDIEQCDAEIKTLESNLSGAK